MSDWRPQIATVLGERWPDLPDGVRWVAAQVDVESAGNPEAVSPAGAQGLLQLMPATWRELGPGGDPFDPLENLRRGVTYLQRQFEHLAEVPSVDERLRWAFASYNGGRGYVNRAFALARLDGEALWWKWTPGRHWLFHHGCVVAGKRPDYRQMWDYVARIQNRATGGIA